MIHGKLFKDQGISFDKTWAGNHELSNNDDIDEGSLLQMEKDDGESHNDRRVIFSDTKDKPQTGFSNWNDTLNLAVRERQMDFRAIIGVDEPQPGCSHAVIGMIH